jgi:spermidine synthase
VLWFFTFFFISGFCSVLYELIWLRLSMAQFGVTSAMVSIVLSVFMAGLGLGSWASGVWIRRREEEKRIGFSPLLLYAAIELLIGISGILVPYELRLGRSLLEWLGSTSSAEYYVVSGIWVALTLIPWCTLMGATIPVAMLAISRIFPKESSRSFSYLYMANVAGAVVGTGLPLILIELLGFHGTLNVGAACNLLIAALALMVSKGAPRNEVGAGTGELPEKVPQPATQPDRTGAGGRSLLALLFATGLTSMGMEVVWVREFTPFIGTVVYAFASILAVYLTGTFVGSRIYRSWNSLRVNESTLPWILVALFSLFPLLAASPDFARAASLRLVVGIAPFTALLGYLTPMLVDRWAGGDPAKAGKAYAVNVVGCIVGPLVAGFLLLPWISERWALVLLSLPWLIAGVLPMRLSGSAPGFIPRMASFLLLPAALVLFLSSNSYEKQYAHGQVLRDSTATVIANGTGMQKALLVNGYGMTMLTPIAKMMAHLPTVFLDHPPQNALVICFGMGTTFRSLRSWGIPVTAVELVPSVPRLFPYFHGDGPALLSSPLSHVVVDDGRRYLERTMQQYDVITIDPPPPVEAAGSSLLYSEDFYSVIRRRLRPGGILQQWLPIGDAEDVAAVALALRRSFPYVRVFAFGKNWGFHFLASDRPLPNRAASELAQRLPAAAAADLVEWDPQPDSEARFAHLLKFELPLDQLISASPSTPALSDDRPINEYYLLRQELRP